MDVKTIILGSAFSLGVSKEVLKKHEEDSSHPHEEVPERLINNPRSQASIYGNTSSYRKITADFLIRDNDGYASPIILLFILNLIQIAISRGLRM